MSSERAVLKHAVLGLVIQRPGYGYELKRRVEERYATWAGQGVYEALDRLEGKGHVLAHEPFKPRSKRSGPPRVVYEATDAGREWWHDWLVSSTIFTPQRQDLDLKIGLSGPAEWPALIDQIGAQELFCVNELRDLTETATAAGSVGSGATWAETSAVLERNAAMKMLRARVEWLQEARTAMRLALARGPARP
jgi:DNA-binding PadR family transcriptional regulator